VPRAIGGLGYTLQRPTEDHFLISCQMLKDRIVVLMAGRAAEFLTYGQISTGAADDLAHAESAYGAIMSFDVIEHITQPVKFPWEKLLSAEELATTTALADLILPKDETSPAASEVGVPDFINEWVSADYEAHHEDREIIRGGLGWLNTESFKRFEKRFGELGVEPPFQDRDDQIEPIVKNVLEGSLRSIVGTLTVEELNYDRQKFQQEVQGAAKADLATSGLTIDNFTIQAIRDEVGYMDLIGQQETARRERDARMAKAQADQEAAVREAESQQIKLNAGRDVSLRQAEIESLTAAANAKAAQAVRR